MKYTVRSKIDIFVRNDPSELSLKLLIIYIPKKIARTIANINENIRIL